MHLVPAGLPAGIPGMGEEIEGAIQQAPHPGLHSIWQSYCFAANGKKRDLSTDLLFLIVENKKLLYSNREYP